MSAAITDATPGAGSEAYQQLQVGTRFCFHFKETSMEGMIVALPNKNGSRGAEGDWFKVRMWDGARFLLCFEPSYSHDEMGLRQFVVASLDHESSGFHITIVPSELSVTKRSPSPEPAFNGSRSGVTAHAEITGDLEKFESLGPRASLRSEEL